MRKALVQSMVFLFVFYSGAYSEVNSSPEAYVVAIDVGHSKVDPGALSARGIPEFEFNYKLATELLQALRATGFKQSFLINENGDLQGNSGLKERTRAANSNKVDLFISIHHDSVQEQYLKEWLVGGKRHRYCDAFRGYSIIYSKHNSDAVRSLQFAKTLGDELIHNGLHPSLHHAEDIPGERHDLIDPKRGIYDIDLLVLRDTQAPSVLFEAGIIVNRKEELALATEEHRKRIIRSIVAAVLSFSGGHSDSQRDAGMDGRRFRYTGRYPAL